MLANDIHDWAALVIGSIAFISQLLSMLGMFNSVNVMIWMYGVCMGGMVFMTLSSTLRFWAMDTAWKKAQGDVAKDFDVYGAIEYYPVIRASFVEESAFSSAMGLAIMQSSKDWFAGQLLMMPEDESRIWMGKKDGSSEMFAFYGF